MTIKILESNQVARLAILLTKKNVSSTILPRLTILATTKILQAKPSSPEASYFHVDTNFSISTNLSA
jgi:hypothetical protein